MDSRIETLRALTQGEPGLITLINADLHPEVNDASDLGQAGINPLLNFLQELPLPMLDAASTREMVTSLARIVGAAAADPELHEKLYALSGGHPALTRRS